MATAEVDRVSSLLATYLFEDLSPAEVDPLARAATVRRLDRDEYLSHVGDPAHELWIVAAGQLKDQLVTEDGDELVHSFYGPGMVLGEPGYFAAERNRIMAIAAVEPTTVVVLGRTALEPFLRRHPEVVTRVIEGLASVTRTQNRLIVALARRPLQARLVLRLLELAETNVPREDGAAVTPKISQSTLAAMVGVSRENANRALAALAAQGTIGIESGRTSCPTRTGCAWTSRTADRCSAGRTGAAADPSPGV